MCSTRSTISWRRTSSRRGPEGGDPRKCPNCETGRLSLKLGRFGAFIGCSNYPDCNFTRQMTPGANGGINGTKVLGEDPVTGLEVSLRGGRFGPYLQLGEQKKPEKKGEEVEKPKRAGLPKGLAPDDVDLEKALGAFGAAARSRHPSGRRRADHRRRRPLRPLRQARQDLRQSGRRRRRA